MSEVRKTQRLRTVVIGIALAACLAEIGWRVYLFQFASARRVAKFARMDYMPEHALKFRPHPYLSYCLNERYRSDDGLNRHNSLGLRGAEVSKAKRAGVYRIACIGGSTTYETGVHDDRETYPALLESILRTQHGHPEIEVLNAGVPGYTSWESLLALELCVLELEPDLVIYYDNTNDVHPRLVDPAEYRRDNSGYRTPWTVESPVWDHSLLVRWLGVQMGFSPRNELIERTTRARPAGLDLEAALTANPPVYFAQNLAGMAHLARERKVELMLASWAHCPGKNDLASTPVYQRGFRENNEVLERVARENDLAWFDFAAAMPTDPDLWHDGAHVNERGARKKAELFAAFVAARLRGP